MRGIGLVALLIAGAVSACRSPPLVNRPDALGPSVVVRHVVETDVEVPEEHADALEPGSEIGRAVPGCGSPVGRTTRKTRDRAGTAPRTATDEDGPDGVAATTGRAPGWTGGAGHVPPTESAEPATTTAPEEAQDGDLATAPVSPTPASIQPVEGERDRSGVSASPWPWAVLAVVLVVAGVLLVRRLRARSRLRSHRYDPDDAWDVFQAGLARKPGSGRSTG